jgi:hypothetical protein
MKNLRWLLALVPAIAFAQPTITTTSLPNGVVNFQYSATLACTNCNSTVIWQVTSGSLPPLLSLNGPTISGNPTAAGTFNFTISLTVPGEAPATKALSITINPPLSITTTSVPNGVLNVSYSAPLTASGGLPPYSWSAKGLPPGLSVTGSNITGTPTTAGTYSFTVVVNDNYEETVVANLSMTIVTAPLSITSTSVPVGFQGVAYTTTINGNGGSPPYAWSLGSISDGLVINSTTGVISGTPTATGQFTLNVTVTDTNTTQVTKGFTLNVLAPLTITTTALPNGTVGNAYPPATATATLAATGGQAPYTWSIPATSLPPGITLNTATGALSGTPTATGLYTFTATVKDSQLNAATASLSISIGGGITITPATLPAGSVGVAYSQALTATGGKAPYTWSIVAGALPSTFNINATSGLISGTATAAGTFTFSVQATDSAGAIGQMRYVLTIGVGPLTITTTSLPDGTVGVPYSQTLAAVGGLSPYKWAVTTGTLPAGLTLAAATGIISGTPTAVATTPFTVTVTDANVDTPGTAKQALSITIATPLTVTPTTLPAAVVGTAYSQKFTAAGGKAPYTFALTGTLPAGFTFTASTATIAGTATVAESGTFTITATDASNRTVSLPLTLTAAAAPLSVSPTTLPPATVGVAYSQTLVAKGGAPPYTFALTLGNLPAGFSFNPATQTISGTATAAESGNFTITVTDSAKATLPVGLTLTANNPPTPSVTVTLTGNSTSGFEQQIPLAVAIGTPYPVDITGSVTLTFAPSVTPAAGVDDAMIQFSSGSRVVSFTIPANTTTVNLTNASSITVLTGTTAGTITLTTSLTAGGVALTAPAPQKIVNTSGVPFISSVSFQQTPGGVTVTVVGFSSTRDMVSGLFHFAPAAGVTFTQQDVTVQLGTAYSTWWTNTAQSNPFGTQFTLTMPFTTSTQATSVVSVTVTLTNSKGASNAVTLSQ